MHVHVENVGIEAGNQLERTCAARCSRVAHTINLQHTHTSIHTCSSQGEANEVASSSASGYTARSTGQSQATAVLQREGDLHQAAHRDGVRRDEGEGVVSEDA